MWLFDEDAAELSAVCTLPISLPVEQSHSWLEIIEP